MKDNQQPSFIQFYDYVVYSDGRLYSNEKLKFLQGSVNDNAPAWKMMIPDEKTGKNKQRHVRCHRLIAQLFIKNPNNYKYVMHKDGNVYNNNVDNLYWTNIRTHYSKKRTQPQPHTEDLEGEKWLVIPDYPFYSVSNKGRVKNIATNKILNFIISKKSYRVRLAYDINTNATILVAKLVYCVFNNDYDLEGTRIIHIDGDYKNNNLDNLQKVKIKNKEGSTTIP